MYTRYIDALYYTVAVRVSKPTCPDDASVQQRESVRDRPWDEPRNQARVRHKNLFPLSFSVSPPLPPPLPSSPYPLPLERFDFYLADVFLSAAAAAAAVKLRHVEIMIIARWAQKSHCIGMQTLLIRRYEYVRTN